MKTKKLTALLSILLISIVLFTACSGGEEYKDFTTAVPNDITVAEGETYIGDRLELFVDDKLVDSEKTTAERIYYSPEKHECVLTFDAAWEGDGCCFFNFISDGETYRMYYIAKKSPTAENNNPKAVVCYAESSDGFTWTKPELNIIKYDGSTKNNILLSDDSFNYANFYAFKDTNPNCKAEEKYKAVALGSDGKLYGYASADAKNWTKIPSALSSKGTFKTLNVAFYDTNTSKYYTYISTKTDGTMSFSVMRSSDFKVWDSPVSLGYGDDAPLFNIYTAGVTPYYRAPHIWLGLTSRYIDRQMLNADGVGLTDCVFMASRNGKDFVRSNEAVLTPGAQSNENWVLGDCVPCVGMLEIPVQREPGNPQTYQDNQICVYFPEGTYSGEAVKLYRYQMRIDGFASYSTNFNKDQILVTEPVIFKGSNLIVNYRTAGGSEMVVKILDKNGNQIEGYESVPLFGDSVRATVVFKDGKKISDLAGTPIIIEFDMNDTDLFSYKFE